MVAGDFHENAAVCFAEYASDGDKNVAGLKQSSAACASAGNVDAFEAKFDG